MQQLSDKQIRSLRSRAFTYGRRRGMGFQSAEDYAQYVTMQVCCHDKPSNLAHLLADHIRESLGRTGARDPRNCDWQEFKDAYYASIPPDVLNAVARAEGLIASGRVPLCPRERKIFYLSLGGFEAKDIADLLKLTVSRICQIQSTLVEKFLTAQEKPKRG